MSSRANGDTTAHRYFQPHQIACVAYSMDRGFAVVYGQVDMPDWVERPARARTPVIEAVHTILRGATAKEAYEHGGADWATLERPEQARREVFAWLVTGMAVVQL